jgi:hypothetical protein
MRASISQRIRKKIEEGFGSIKTVAGQEQTKFRSRLDLHLRGSRLQSGAAAKADGGAGMSAPAGCKLRSLADRRGGHLGSSLSRSVRADEDRHGRRR